MPRPQTLRRMDEYWAGVLGCAADDLRRPGVRVVAHGTIRGFGGAWVLRRGESCIVSVPPGMISPMTPVFTQHTPAEVFAAQRLADIFRHPVTSIIGPSYIGCADETDLPEQVSSNARPLDQSDAAALADLLAESGSSEADDLPLDMTASTIFGQFNGRRLVAIAVCMVREQDFASLGVLTHPTSRGRGHGTSVALAAARWAVESGYQLCWRADRANAGSVGLAERLGFADYASHFVVRLKW